MNDLREFLLARMDEQEQRLDACRDWPECDPEYGCPAHPRPGNRRAEIDAFRQVLFWQQQAAWPSYDALTEEDAQYDRGQAYGLELAMQLLALPYASHPDYMEEWRPE